MVVGQTGLGVAVITTIISGYGVGDAGINVAVDGTGVQVAVGVKVAVEV
jgi:hypothetical protein